MRNMEVKIRFRREEFSKDYINVVVDGPSKEVLELVGMVRNTMYEAHWKELS